MYSLYIIENQLHMFCIYSLANTFDRRFSVYGYDHYCTYPVIAMLAHFKQTSTSFTIFFERNTKTIGFYNSCVFDVMFRIVYIFHVFYPVMG